mmetsp:Transcript_7922/g.14665  ORF Transcript_7922/g.14665 Transcript_7922/m.14665 type:complete len:311 (+) Transcript_7922:148-1080(+)
MKEKKELLQEQFEESEAARTASFAHTPARVVPLTTPTLPILITCRRSLGIVFDIDGTLVAEHHRVQHSFQGIQLRPHTIEFLVWCKSRGHRLALWTAGSATWAGTMAQYLCTMTKIHEADDQNHHHRACRGRSCTRLFDFVWDGTHMRRERARKTNHEINNGDSRHNGHCRWCEFYSHSCNRCTCRCTTSLYCPCRATKDLRKIWYSSDPSTAGFRPETTLLVENTPQNCRYNYGNAIYVRTYRGQQNTDTAFRDLQVYVEQVLEPSSAMSVRSIPKCKHCPPGTPHACFEQDWWSEFKQIQTTVESYRC